MSNRTSEPSKEELEAINLMAGNNLLGEVTTELNLLKEFLTEAAESGDPQHLPEVPEEVEDKVLHVMKLVQKANQHFIDAFESSEEGPLSHVHDLKSIGQLLASKINE